MSFSLDRLILTALKARESGESEVRVNHLVSAVRDAAESNASENHLPESIKLFASAPHRDLPLSREGKRLIAPLEDFDTVSVDRLRSMLLRLNEIKNMSCAWHRGRCIGS